MNPARVGVESAYGFGDCLFNAPLIRAISEHYGMPVGVAVKPSCKDAFYNLPWVDQLIDIAGLHQGAPALSGAGYGIIHQITQNVKFLQYRDAEPNHSLIDTPAWVGRELGLPEFDPRPVIRPTPDELAVGARYDDGMPTIAVESVYNSGQSWADQTAFQAIIDKYGQTHRICWLSPSGAPNTPYVDDMLRWTRRQAICALTHCGTFFSVGSGFFCASLALPQHLQPKRIVCMWRDEFYKYEGRLAEVKWHPNIQWVHNLEQLMQVM